MTGQSTGVRHGKMLHEHKENNVRKTVWQRTGSPMRLITFHLNKGQINDIDYFIHRERYPNLSEFVRAAVMEKIHLEYMILNIRQNLIQLEPITQNTKLPEKNGDLDQKDNADGFLNALKDCPHTRKEMSERLGVSLSRITTVAKFLERKGLVHSKIIRSLGKRGRDPITYFLKNDEDAIK